MLSIFKTTTKKGLYKYGNAAMKICIGIFFLLFYLNMICTLNSKFSTFIFLFTFLPLCIAVGFCLLIPVSFLYLFALGFLIQWILFLNVNPYPIENGNKYAIMSFIPDKYKPEQEYLLTKMTNQEIENMKYPIIMKPIVCSGGGSENYIFHSYAEFVDLMIQKGKKLDTSQFMIQKYLEDYDVEITVLYERKPWEKRGKVMEIVEKTQKDEIRPQIEGFTLNHPELITDKLIDLFDEISKKIPDFYTGRYDIRLQNLEDLETGVFKILEVNGTMGMYLMSNDFMFDLNDFIIDFKWYWTRIIIGGYNMATLRGYGPLHLLQVLWISLIRAIGCDTWENLFSLYS